jgi:hypothetical protein
MIEIHEVVDIVGIYDSNIKQPNGTPYPIGTIKVAPIGATNATTQTTQLAIPATTIRRIPLKHELVACFRAPILGANEGRVDTGLYYLDPVNIQNTVHINVLPEMSKPGTFLGGIGSESAKVIHWLTMYKLLRSLLNLVKTLLKLIMYISFSHMKEIL